MQHHDAVVGEQFAAPPEVSLVKVNPDVLQHAHRDHAVERSGNVAIILKEKLRRWRQVFLSRAVIRYLQLFGRKRNASDIGAGHFGQIQPKTSPTGADVKYAVAVPDQQLRSEMPLLGELGIVKRCIRRFKIGAAVLLVSIEEERVEAPVEVVMACDIVFRTSARI